MRKIWRYCSNVTFTMEITMRKINTKTNKMAKWIKKELHVEGTRKRTQEALLASGGHFMVVVHRTLKSRVEDGEKAFTFKLLNLKTGRETKRGTRLSCNA